MLKIEIKESKKLKSFQKLTGVNESEPLVQSEQIEPALHKKRSFPLRISSVNVIKAAVSCGFGHINRRNPTWKTLFLCAVQSNASRGNAFTRKLCKNHSYLKILVPCLGNPSEEAIFESI